MPSSSSGSVRVFYPRHSRDELIALLRRDIVALASVLPLERAALFGSWATGRATAFSDVDLMVVYADPPRADAYRLVCEAVGVRGLEAHVYAASEAAAIADTLQRMTSGAVDLL